MFLSDVITKASNPSRSAARRRSPLRNSCQPISKACLDFDAGEERPQTARDAVIKKGPQAK